MTVESGGKAEAFFATFVSHGNPLLLLDYDGTLAPFNVDRFQARPWAGVRDLLTRIQQQATTRMVIVTGRSAYEIGPLLGIFPRPEIWGLHGAERLFPDGRRELQDAPPATREKLDMLRALLKRDSFGGLFEDKANAAVMHWRGTSPSKARLIERETRVLFEPLAGTNGLELLEFEEGVELRVGRNKGGAVEAILCEADPESPVAYLGDDLTDEVAFRAVNRKGFNSLSVLVRSSYRDTVAELWLRPPAALRGFLECWLQAASKTSNTHLKDISLTPDPVIDRAYCL